MDATSDGIVLRPEERGDGHAIERVVAGAFGSPAQARLLEALRGIGRSSQRSTSELSVHVMVTYATLRNNFATHRVASLSPLAVEPQHQRRGVGSALVRAVAVLAESAHEPMIVLEGSPRYYVRFGFEYSVPLGITMTLPAWAPAEAAQVLRLSHYDASMRGHLEYPAAFGVIKD